MHPPPSLKHHLAWASADRALAINSSAPCLRFQLVLHGRVRVDGGPDQQGAGGGRRAAARQAGRQPVPVPAVVWRDRAGGRVHCPPAGPDVLDGVLAAQVRARALPPSPWRTGCTGEGACIAPLLARMSSMAYRLQG
eukprot:scaffold2546_cov118-Isochrysis_galbana.AAC.6